MAPTTPPGEPSEIVAGDSVRWRIADHTDYPQSEGWTLKYELVGINTQSITAVWQTSGDDKDNWLIELATTATDDLDVGSYQLVKRFVGSGTFAGREETIGRFVVAVRADPRTAADGAFQTPASKQLTLIRTVIEARLTNDTAKEYLVAGRRFVKEDLDTLYRIEARLIAATQTERSGKFGQEILVEFPGVGV